MYSIGLSWPLTKLPFGSCAIYFHQSVSFHQQSALTKRQEQAEEAEKGERSDATDTEARKKFSKIMYIPPKMNECPLKRAHFYKEI